MKSALELAERLANKPRILVIDADKDATGSSVLNKRLRLFNFNVTPVTVTSAEDAVDTIVNYGGKFDLVLFGVNVASLLSPNLIVAIKGTSNKQHLHARESSAVPQLGCQELSAA